MLPRTAPALPGTTEFKVWAEARVFLEEAECLKVVAQFAYLQEALDYIHYALSRGLETIVLTGPYKLVSVYPK